MREIRIGLAGLGHVGSAVARLILDEAPRFSQRLDARLCLHTVCDRHPTAKVRRLGLPQGVRVARDWRILAADPAVDIVVELIGGRGDARRLVLESLRRGKDVVTANKALLSHHWREVFGAAHREGRRVAFEAAVAGGIPILGPLAEGLASNRVRQILGILNGTTNFILSRMVHDRLPFPEALAEAQRRGLAERNPRLDLNGTDTAHKLSILASLVLGGWLPPEAVDREGIEGVDLDDVLFAVEELGRTVRLVGLARFEEGGKLEARVHPMLVPLRHPLAAVHDAYNAVLVETSEAKDLMFYGLGAGPGPAASAVVSDLLTVAQGQLSGRCYLSLLWAAETRPAIKQPEMCEGRFYLRFMAKDRPGVLGRIATVLGRCGVSIAQVLQRPGARREGVPVVLVTHRAREGRVQEAIRRIAGRGGVDRKVILLRML